jgi:hypothetical protein
MIKKRTVFVLGAGANVPYDFSTGAKLLEKARTLKVPELERLTAGRLHRYQLEPLQVALEGNLLPSIDAMLEHRKDLWPAGKQVMAALLYEEEARVAGPSAPTKDDWISLIFEKMCADASSPEQFASNPVSFITFNYDRLLEYRILRGLSAIYGLGETKAWDTLRQIRFLHLHGSLGPLPAQPGASCESVPFGPENRSGVNRVGPALKVAEKTVKIIHDADPKDPVFAEAQSLFHTADRILFFGFGFGKTNVARLGTANIHPAKEIYCTTFDMTNAEIAGRIDPAFSGHAEHGKTIYKDNAQIRQFLRERIWLLG